MSQTVIFVPGYPASHVYDTATGRRLFLDVISLLLPTRRQEVLRRLEGPDDLTVADLLQAGDPVRRLAKFLLFDLAKQAESLYDLLDRVGAKIVPFGWDWRRPVYDASMQARLAATIVRESAQAPVTLIAHSTGGLLIRHLLESRAGDAAFLGRVRRLIAFGVPWAGTLKSFLFLAGAEGFATVIPPDEAQRLVATTWVAYDLLPPDPTTTPLVSAQGAPLDLVVDAAGAQIGPLRVDRRGWFPAHLAPRMHPRADAAVQRLGTRASSLQLGGHPLEVINIAGWGTSTTVQASLAGADGAIVSFTDGKGDATLDGGDGTVPRRSAAWLRGGGVRSYHVPVGLDPGAQRNPHSTLWRNPGGRNLVWHHLGGKPLEPFVYGALDDDDFFGGDPVRIRLVALDPNGQALPGAAVRPVDLTGSPPPAQPFDLAFEGRHLLRVPRSRIRAVGAQLRRLRLRVSWQEAGGTATEDLSFFARR